ncbi:MAG: C10 family peptidase [Tannerellaceae bacterium]|jgi:hypothetical protein|nr:C10 family peptidase [Tannerellaceae bacterium]
MKKTLLAGIMAIFVMSCDDESKLLTDSMQPVNIDATDINTKISAEEAKQHALTVLNDLEDVLAMNGGVSLRSGSNSGNNRTVKDVQAVRVGNKENIHELAERIGLTESVDTLMYIINFEDNKGYVIAAADERTDAVYAIIDQGILSADSLGHFDNPGFTVFMEEAAFKMLADMKENLGKPKKDNAVTYATSLTWLDANIRLKTRWNQWAPYNQYCPWDDGQQCPTGCIATAVAQIVAYYQTVGNVQWSYNGSSGSAVLNWDRIISDCNNNDGALPATTASANEVAHLMRYLGIAMGANYSADGTSIEENAGVNWMNKWGGLSATSLSNYNQSTISSALIANTVPRKLVYMRANSGKKTFLGITTGYTGGHAWVIDGQYVNLAQGKTYFHCNFGWGGRADGFYLSDAFDTTAGPVYIIGDDPGNTNSSNYRYNKQISVVSCP